MLMHISFGPKIPLPEIYSSYVSLEAHRNLSAEMFPALLFVIAESWKQPKCQLVGTNSMNDGAFYTIEYCANIYG